jgi:hypothetical protein
MIVDTCTLPKMFAIEVKLPVCWPSGHLEGLYDLLAIFELKNLLFLSKNRKSFGAESAVVVNVSYIGAEDFPPLEPAAGGKYLPPSWREVTPFSTFR